jgi:hypothetical protein
MSRIAFSLWACALAPILLIGCLTQAIDLTGLTVSNVLSSLTAKPLALYGAPIACQELRDPDICLGHYFFSNGGFPPPEPSALSCRDADLGLAAELNRILAAPDGDRPISMARVASRVREDAEVLLTSPGTKPNKAVLDGRASKFVAQPRFQILFAAFCTPDPADAAMLLPVLLRGLDDPLPETSALAAIGLGKLGRNAMTVVDHLAFKAANNKDPIVRSYAAYAQWQIDGKPGVALEVLTRELASKVGGGVPELAVLLLGRMGSDAVGAVPSLCALLDDESPSVRAQVVFALGEIGPGAVSAVPNVCKLLGDSEDAQQLPLQECELRIGDVEYVGDTPTFSFRIYRKSPMEMMRRMLRYRSVRSYAAIALARIGCADATVIASLKALKNESLIGTIDHQSAAEALRVLGK